MSFFKSDHILLRSIGLVPLLENMRQWFPLHHPAASSPLSASESDTDGQFSFALVLSHLWLASF